MPEGFDYADISISDFETALNTYLRELTRKGKEDRSFWDAIVWNLPFGIGGKSLEDVDDVSDRMFTEIMEAVLQYGLSPNTASSLNPQTADVFNRVLLNRTSYDWQKKYKQDIAQWQKDVVKFTQEGIVNQQRDRAFKLQQEQFDFRKEQTELAAAERKRQFDIGAGIDISDAANLRFREQRAQRADILQSEQQRQMRVAGGFGGGGGTDPFREEMRIQDEREFEQIRKDMLSGLPSAPREVFRTQLESSRLKALPNPFAAGTEAFADEEKRLQESVKSAQSELKEAQANFKAASARVSDVIFNTFGTTPEGFGLEPVGQETGVRSPLLGGPAQSMEQAQLEAATQRLERAVARESGQRQHLTKRQEEEEPSPFGLMVGAAEDASIGGIVGGLSEGQNVTGAEMAVRAKQVSEFHAAQAREKEQARIAGLPTIPKQLSKAFGVGRFDQPFVRPSAQQLNRATFTAREQFAGFAESKGLNWQDVLERVRLQTPQRRRGARTTPFAQRT